MEISTLSTATRTRKVRVLKATEPKTGKSTLKPPAVKSVAKPAAKASSARKAVTTTVPRTEPPAVPAKRKAVSRKPAVATPVVVDLAPLIATAAYFMAERRNFAPGQELQDWLAAEKIIQMGAG